MQKNKTCSRQQIMSSYKKILFIDDNYGDLFYVRKIIELFKIPLEPHFGNNAIEALEYLESIEQADFPDIIMVDINMPLVNGFEFISSFKKKFPTKVENTTIYIISTSSRQSDKNKIKQFSIIQDYIEKPISREFLFELAKN